MARQEVKVGLLGRDTGRGGESRRTGVTSQGREGRMGSMEVQRDEVSSHQTDRRLKM